MASERDKASGCTCGWPERAVTQQWKSIIYDEEMGEFQLVFDCGDRGKGYARLRYCPSCGESLRESKRHTFFTVPTEADEADLLKVMEKVTTVGQMLETLGEPSDTCHRAWLRQYTYDARWDSLILIVHEYDDGHIQIGCCGKRTGRGE